MITMFIGLHHIYPEHLNDFIQSLYETLRPNGMLILTEHNVYNMDQQIITSSAHSIYNLATPEQEQTE